MRDITRRHVLTLLAASVVAACSEHSAQATPVPILPPFDVLSTPAVRALATAVNRAAPAAARVTHDLLAAVPIAERRALLDERSRADARLGRTVKVDGWVLPVHLAGLAGAYER